MVVVRMKNVVPIEYTRASLLDGIFVEIRLRPGIKVLGIRSSRIEKEIKGTRTMRNRLALQLLLLLCFCLIFVNATLGQTTKEYAPDVFSHFRGTPMGGVIDDILVSDDQHYTLSYSFGITPCDVVASIFLDTNLDTDLPQTLSFSIESHGNTPGIRMGFLASRMDDQNQPPIPFEIDFCFGTYPIPLFVDQVVVFDMTDCIPEIVE